jgi:hypothetical protein
MSTKPSSPAPTVIDAPKSTAVVTWKDKMAAVTAQAATMEAPKGGFISFKGGNMSYDDNLIPGNQMDVIVVDFLLENNIFREKYNPNKPASPMCYALGREEDELKPHEDCEEPQHTGCIDCPNNEWGSDPEGGRGKACKNTRRIAVIPADALKLGVDGIKKAGVVMCKLPVTSLKNFSTFVNQCVKVMDTPPFGVIVRMSTKPHPTSLFQVHWTILNKVENQEHLEALYDKHVSVEKQLFQPYPKMDEEQAPAPKQSKKF